MNNVLVLPICTRVVILFIKQTSQSKRNITFKLTLSLCTPSSKLYTCDLKEPISASGLEEELKNPWMRKYS